MKHRKFGKKLGRNHNQRQALFRSQVTSIFTHGYIKTTDAKAKALIPLVEKLASIITNKSEVIAQRELAKLIQNRQLVSSIYKNFKTIFVDQKFNFTQVTKIKFRQGDDALIVKLSFIKPYSAKINKEEKTGEEKKEIKKETVKKTVKKTTTKKPAVKKVVNKKE